MTLAMSDPVLRSSFRDPSGFVFRHQGRILRQVNRLHAADYDQLMSSGLYDELMQDGTLIPHREIDGPLPGTPHPELHHLTLEPEPIDFLSYAYEWCFSQFKDAARITLAVQQRALEFGMTLKDASVYNVQFHRGRPLLIDTLSFERYEEGAPWAAYRQFCQHFLAPLSLMSRVDVRLGELLRVHLDGIPLDLAVKLLPWRALLRPGLFMHVWMHSRYQTRYASAGSEAAEAVSSRRLSASALKNLTTGLQRTIEGLDWEPTGTEWASYYEGDSYDDDSFAHKREIVGRFLDQVAPDRVWDLGANTGVHSWLAVDRGARVVAFDVDPAAVEQGWREVKKRKEECLLPLVLDLANPSPASGWAHEERDSLVARADADLVIGLALIHHLAIGNNVPLGRISRFLASLAPRLVIEFVPKSDAKVKTMLLTREDIFPDYTPEGFAAAFNADWEIEETVSIQGSDRTLHLLRRRAA